MKTTTLLLLGAAAAGTYHFYGVQLGLRKLDESTPGAQVVMRAGRTYEITVASPSFAGGGSQPQMIELAPGVRAVAVPVPGGAVLVFKPNKDEVVSIGQQSDLPINITRVREV